MRKRDATGWVLVAIAVSIVGAVVLRRGGDREPAVAEKAAVVAPAIDRRERYVGAHACERCHADEHKSWHGSYHRTMTQRASPISIKAPFTAGALDEGGLYRVERVGDDYFVSEPGKGRQKVALVTGSHLMQVYWPEAGAGGRLEAFAYAYLLDDKRWVPNDATLLRPPAAKVTFTWNRVCIKCHAVAGVPGYDAEADKAQTRVAELGISCEACHGPGMDHVMTKPEPVAGDGTIVHPEGIEPRLASQVCGQCHSITMFHDDAAWVKAGHEAAPPDPIEAWGSVVQHPLMASNERSDALMDEDPDFFSDRYWSDGMVRVSGREYNGLIESPCATDPKFSCLTCHQLHGEGQVDGGPWNDDQLRPGVRDGTVCLTCHKGLDTKAHTKHDAADGTNCLNCHMPRTTYGLLKAIRSHRIDTPDIEATEVTGRPIACNLCHQDKPLRWTEHWLDRWWGEEAAAAAEKKGGAVEGGGAKGGQSAVDGGGPHVGGEPAAVRAGRTAEGVPGGGRGVQGEGVTAAGRAADAELAVEFGGPPAVVEWLLAGDAGQRALMAWHLAWEPAHAVSGVGWQGALLELLLDDSYAAIRLIAERSLAQLPAATRKDIVDAETLAKLRSQRNDRPVSLAE